MKPIKFRLLLNCFKKLIALPNFFYVLRTIFLITGLTTFILFINFILPKTGYCQNDVNPIICNCFDNNKNIENVEELRGKIQYCLEKEYKNNRKEFKLLFNSVDNELQLIRKLASKCEPFFQFLTYMMDDYYKQGERERRQITNEIAGLLSYPAKKKKLQEVKININEVGVIYNLCLNRPYKDSILNHGKYKIMPFDTVFIFNTNLHMVKEKLNFQLTDNLKSTIYFELSFSIKSKKAGQVFKYYTKDYKKYLLPKISNILNDTLTKYSSLQLSEITLDSLSRIFISAVNSDKNIEDFFRIYKIKIKQIDYPQIIAIAQEANLFEEYKNLQKKDKNFRLTAINNLFKNRSEAAFLLLMEHWQFEKEKEIKDYIIKKLSSGIKH